MTEFSEQSLRKEFAHAISCVEIEVVLMSVALDVQRPLRSAGSRQFARPLGAACPLPGDAGSFQFDSSRSTAIFRL